jgi:hypothetical protein
MRVTSYRDSMVRPEVSLAVYYSLIHLAPGDIVFLQLPGINMVNVNSLHLAHELLSRRANTTGGRRMGYMAGVM